jgi:hypothetical protein
MATRRADHLSGIIEAGAPIPTLTYPDRYYENTERWSKVERKQVVSVVVAGCLLSAVQ